MAEHKGQSAESNSSGGAEPQASRPEMPGGYISEGSEGLLPWSWLDERMSKAINYWIATTRPDGRPHVMPVWGVWLDGIFYFGTDPNSRKARNLKANPQMAVHLESADEVVIVEGKMEEVGDRARSKQVGEAYLAKYEMPMGHGSEEAPLYSLRPRVAFGWEIMKLNESATRWHVND